MASGRKSLNNKQVDEVYKKAFREKFNWNEILNPESCQYLQLIAQAYNSPVTLTVSGLMPLISAVCGPNTKVQISSNFESPLNTYIISVCTKGGGKSSLFRFISEITDSIEEYFDVKMLVENYTAPGLQTHQIENKGYALVCSDEGQIFLSSLSNKQRNNEAERARLNKLWTGRGDSMVLKDSTRSFVKSSFSISVLIQPTAVLSELINLGLDDDGLFDRILFMVVAPRMYMSNERADAAAEINTRYSNPGLVDVFRDLFESHRESAITYKFTDDAQSLLDSMCDESAQEFNALYPSETGMEIVYYV
jgi:hypothetical protein